MLQDLETWGWLWERTPLLYCLLHEGGCAGNSVEEGVGSRIKPGVLYRVTVTANGQEAAVPPGNPGGQREERTASSRESLKELHQLWS